MGTLALFWIAMLTGALLLAFDAWPKAPMPDPPIAGSWLSLGLALGDAMERGFLRVGVFYSGVLAAPLIAFTWLALPRDDRRTFPAVLVLWTVLSLAAYTDLLPSTDPARFVIACLPALLTAEVLRSLVRPWCGMLSTRRIPAR